MPRHRLDAVDAGAEVDAIQVQLENLLFREIGIDHQRERGLADLPAVRLLVRQEQRPRELLRQGAAAFDAARGPDVAHQGAAERNRIHAEVMVEPVILDRHECVLQVERDIGERHILPALVHPEPLAAVGGKEPGIADTAVELVDGPGLPEGPHQADGRHDHEGAENDGGNAVADTRRNGDPGNHERGPRRASSMNESTA